LAGADHGECSVHGHADLTDEQGHGQRGLGEVQRGDGAAQAGQRV